MHTDRRRLGPYVGHRSCGVSRAALGFVVLSALSLPARLVAQGASPVQTDRKSYIARAQWPDRVGEAVVGRYAFKVVATLHNRTSDTLYLERCRPDSPTPEYSLVVAEKPDEDAAWDPTWACAGFYWHEPLAPGAARTDTFPISGPNMWEEGSGQPIGVLNGRFRLKYGLRMRTCPDSRSSCRAPDSLSISNAFDVRIAPYRRGHTKQRSTRVSCSRVAARGSWPWPDLGGSDDLCRGAASSPAARVGSAEVVEVEIALQILARPV